MPTLLQRNRGAEGQRDGGKVVTRPRQRHIPCHWGQINRRWGCQRSSEKDTQPDVGNARMNPARPASARGRPWRCFPCLFGFDQLPLFGFAAAENAITYSAICCAGSKAPELRAPNWPRNRIDGRRLLSNDELPWKLNGHERQLLSKAWLVAVATPIPRNQAGHSNDD